MKAWPSLELWEKFLIFLGVIFYMYLFDHHTGGDGFVRYDNLLHLFSTGELRPMVYSYVGPLVSSPLLLIGRIFLKDPHWWVARFNTFVLFFTLWVLYRELRKEWSATQTRRFVLLMFCATMFPRHVTDYYSEVFSACLAALAIFAYGRNRFAAGSIYLCLSVWNTPGTALAGLLVVAYYCYREQRLRYLGVLAALVLGIMVENYLKFHEFFPRQYLLVQGDKNLLPYTGGPGFSYPLFFGVLSVLFSYGKGLLFFSPLLLGLFSHHTWSKPGPIRDFLLVGSLYLVGLILVFSRWWSWYGGYFWGPRFYLFASLLSCVVLAHLWSLPGIGRKEKLFCFFACLVSFWIGLEGISYGQDFLDYCYVRHDGSDFMCQYVPEFSSLWRFFVVWPRLQGRRVAFFIYFIWVALTVLWGPGKELLAELRNTAKKAWRQKIRGRWRI